MQSAIAHHGYQVLAVVLLITGLLMMYALVFRPRQLMPNFHPVFHVRFFLMCGVLALFLIVFAVQQLFDSGPTDSSLPVTAIGAGREAGGKVSLTTVYVRRHGQQLLLDVPASKQVCYGRHQLRVASVTGERTGSFRVTYVIPAQSQCSPGPDGNPAARTTSAVRPRLFDGTCAGTSCQLANVTVCSRQPAIVLRYSTRPLAACSIPARVRETLGLS